VRADTELRRIYAQDMPPDLRLKLLESAMVIIAPPVRVRPVFSRIKASEPPRTSRATRSFVTPNLAR
jgi:hypothetical protein